jgi:hypothetical protein
MIGSKRDELADNHQRASRCFILKARRLAGLVVGGSWREEGKKIPRAGDCGWRKLILS